VGELERLLKRPLPTAVADQTTFLEDLKRSEARSAAVPAPAMDEGGMGAGEERSGAMPDSLRRAWVRVAGSAALVATASSGRMLLLGPRAGWWLEYAVWERWRGRGGQRRVEGWGRWWQVGKVVAQLKKHVHERVKLKAQQVREAWSGLLPASHREAAQPGPPPASNGIHGKAQVPPLASPSLACPRAHLFRSAVLAAPPNWPPCWSPQPRWPACSVSWA
jgi:hypothetical protein